MDLNNQLTSALFIFPISQKEGLVNVIKSPLYKKKGKLG